MLVVLLAGVLIAAPAATRAQDGASGEVEDLFTVDRRGPELVEVEPGEAAIIPFMVKSSAMDTLDLVFRAHLPNGWRINGGDQPRRLAPGETHLRLLSVSADVSAGAGTAAVRLEATRASDASGDLPPESSVGDSVILRLAAHPSISLSQMAAGDLVVAGQEYGAAIEVVNSGNVPLDLEFGAKSGGGYRTTVAPARIRLDPSGRIQLHVHVWTTPGIQRATREVLRVEARSPDLPGTGRHEISVGLDLLPAEEDAAGDRYHRLPVEVRLAASPGAGGVPPFRISGSGPLFDDGDARIAFVAQGPAVERSLTGARDAYSVRYRSDEIDLRLGDHAFAATPLTGYATSGAGAGASISLGALRMGGHHAIDRQSATRPSTSSAFLGVMAGPAELEARWQSRSGAGGGALIGGRGRLKLHPGLSLDGELASATGYEAVGHRLDVSGRLPIMSYRVTYQDSDLLLPVPASGARHLAADLQVRPFSWLRLFGQADQSVGRGFGLGSDQTKSTTTQQRTAGVGLAGRLTLEWTERRHRRSSDGGSEEWDHRSRVLRGRGGLRGSFWSIRPQLEIGEGTHAQTGEGGLGYGGALEMTIRAGDHLSLSGTVEHRFGAVIDPMYNSRRSGLRVALASALTASTRMNVSWSESRGSRPLQASSRMVELTIRHRLAFGHEMEARVRSAPPRNTPLVASLDDPMVHLSYNIPLSIPVSRSSTSGQLRLRVVDELTGAPVSEVHVAVAGTFGVTDRRGELRLGGLPPGDHAVRLDRGTAGLTRVVADPEALHVTIRAGREVTREVSLVTGTSLSGSIRRFRFEREPIPNETASPALLDAGGFADAIVEVSRGEEVHRVSPDSDGAFELLGLLPGEWTVRVVAQLPDWHVLEPASMLVELGASHAGVANFRIVPVRRSIRLITPKRGRDSPDR